MKVIFAGTPEFAARALAALLASRHEVVLVLTQPDRPSGRGMRAHPSAVKQLAVKHGLAFRQPETLRDVAEHGVLAEAVADIMIVAAFGLILPQAVLDIPRLGAINIHASLLPRWRGAAPIQRALLAGDSKTGISIMNMDAGLDTGPVIHSEETPIGDADNAQTLHDRLADIGARLILEVLDRYEQGTVNAVPQSDRDATYAAKISKSEARIDWNCGADHIWRQIRAFNPNPGAAGHLRQTEVKIWQARVASSPGGKGGEILQADSNGLLVACGADALWLDQLQKPGGKRLQVGEFLRGFPVAPGEMFVS
jgi:methionyl-tRNA formyltransferase